MRSRRTLCALDENTDRHCVNNHFTNNNILITDPLITDQLRQRLLALDFPSFARCICRLLDALGYENTQPTGRRKWKGYNRHGGGGYDLEAALPGGLAPRRVIAQVKQYDTLAVHQRSVDELRGACLRAGASEAVLVTTSTFSEVVRRSERVRTSASSPDAAGTLVAPIRLIDGEELVRLLIRHRLGVRERGLCRVRRLELDEAFFASIAPPSAPTASCQRSAQRSAPRQSCAARVWRVTIQICPSQIAPNTYPKTWRRGRQTGSTDGEGKG